MGKEPVAAGSGRAGKNDYASPLGHCRLTVSPASTDVVLIILRAVDLAAALLDDLFAHPAGYSDPDAARELIVPYCAIIEFFRSLLERCWS